MTRSPGAPPDPDELRVDAVLLATEEREFPREAVELAGRLAERSDAPVHVFGIARVWGTSFGFPNPGLQPTRQEWDAQRMNVERAVKALRRRGLRAEGQVLGTRAAAKRIVQEARRVGAGAIVMGADTPRNRFVADFFWSQEPYRVRRRARIPVYLVVPS
ncbi:MAG: universal stress protein [Actinomycetota bacterium]|nr:universal stress protein [Actinomycetota bacterium]